jgi:hypothetical protein
MGLRTTEYGRASCRGYDETSPTLRDRWRLIYEIIEVVSADFLLDCTEQV